MRAAFAQPHLSATRRREVGTALRALGIALVLLSVGCATLRGRADDALERRDYRRAVELYGQLVAKEPNDAKVKGLLTRAERGLLDEMLDRAEAARKGNDQSAAMNAALEAIRTKDELHADSVDPPRVARVTATIDWAAKTVRQTVVSETSHGRALAAAAQRAKWTPWLQRPELAAFGPELDAEIAKAGAKSCARSTQVAGEQPFALELVAAYCKAVGGEMPAWKPRPLLVSGVAISGGIIGTPPVEQIELERAVTSALERSVWFTAMTDARASAQVQGNVVASFTQEPTELSRSWTERIPYQVMETYQEPVQVPYSDTEMYTESVPYTAYESRSEPCSPPQKGMCSASHPVTRYRSETRMRPVTRFRTEYRNRTRQVTRYRDEARVFRYPATKHEGRYQATFFVRLDLGSGMRPIEARGSAEDARSAYEHDAEFAPAGVHPEQATLPSAMWWRQQQRERIHATLLQSLDAAWTQSFCSEGVSSIEEAARCARARQQPIPQAVRTRIVELFGDDPDRVFALPRPGETAH
jgi:hypothetical protein